MPGRYVSDPARNHSSKHGSDTAAANEYMSHHSATAWSVWAASQVLSGLLAAIFALPACGSLSTPRF